MEALLFIYSNLRPLLLFLKEYIRVPL